MKKILIIFLVLAGCSTEKSHNLLPISLAGEWKFKMDSLDKGIENKWFTGIGTENVKLPGSMAENGKGDDVTLKTPWTGDIIDKSYFTESKYEKYRQPGNIKIPFWLKPVRYYKGPAWYQKEVVIPDGWNGKRILLFLERCHWESTVYVNDKKAGSRNSLATPHEYDITDLVVPGKNLLSIRIDNRVIIPIGVNSHSISDHTQSNWNGITGEISLKATSKVFISDIRVYPDLKKKSAKVIVTVSNKYNDHFNGSISLKVDGLFSLRRQSLKTRFVMFDSNSESTEIVSEYPMGHRMKLWSEFQTSLYRLSVSLIDRDGNYLDNQSTDFGLREFKANGTRFEINGRQIFLRGTLECCIFPLTGYPPADVKSWERVLQTCKDYGLNHIRFHSWCPPEAAFIAADKLGIYFHIECSSWANQGSSIGNDAPVDRFIYEEGDRILKAYGNHPSFVMMAYGNEPAGKHQKEFLGKLLTYWKSKDNRRVYTSGAGWPIIPENDYNLPSEPRIQHWGEGLKSIINSLPPQTMFDYREYVSKYDVPTVSHEIGQWCVYPDFKEISKYTGVLKPSNFEIFQETLTEHNMGSQADQFLMASGKLQLLCYKAEIEAALRTPGFAGFQLLQLHDFPGQGSALVGMLNPFFEPKGYVTPSEFRMFCNETVPLARLPKEIYTNSETFNAEIELAHFGQEPIKNAVILSQIINSTGKSVHSDSITIDEIKIGNAIPITAVSMDLANIKSSQKLTLKVSVKNTPFRNQWDFWVYPANQEINPGNIFITDKMDIKTGDVLKKGGSVLLLTYGKVGKDKGAKIAIGFSSIFWNTAWTKNQAPHTLGILCDPENPVFSEFPTEYHSNWQWWDPVTHSQAMIINDFPTNLKPLIQPIDTWFENRRLSLVFESKIGKGKLMVCSIDFKDKIDERPVSKQLLLSILNYMNSESFNPQIEVDISRVKGLTAGSR
jgi:hypothetical protein